MHFFGSLFRVLVGGDIGQSNILLLRALPVTYFSLYVETNHHLVDHHTDDGAKEWGKNGHQEPAISNTEEWEKELINLFLLCLHNEWALWECFEVVFHRNKPLMEKMHKICART